jgi:heme exporter protein D
LRLKPHPKRQALILLVVALGAALVLSSGLSQLRLRDALPFPGAASSPAETQESVAGPAPPAIESVRIFEGVLAAVLVGLVLYLLARIIIAADLRGILWIVAAAAGILMLLMLLPRVAPGSAVRISPEGVPAETPEFEYPSAPLGTPPVAFLWIAAGLALAGGALAALVALRRRRALDSLRERLRREAMDAAAAIESGADSTNAIIRCYIEMTRLIQRERGMERERSLTAREFETSLEELGLPASPLTRLRQLFEDVRYGSRKFSPSEERSAVTSLGEIEGFLRAGQ